MVVPSTLCVGWAHNLSKGIKIQGLKVVIIIIREIPKPFLIPFLTTETPDLKTIDHRYPDRHHLPKTTH